MRSIIAQTKKRDKDNAELLIYYNPEKILRLQIAITAVCSLEIYQIALNTGIYARLKP